MTRSGVSGRFASEECAADEVGDMLAEVRRKGGVDAGRWYALLPADAAAAAATIAERFGGVKVRKVEVSGGEGGMIRLPMPETWPLPTIGAGCKAAGLPGGLTCGP